MKKSILAIGVLSMVMVLTSFTTQTKVKSSADLKNNVTAAYGGGSASGGGTIKLD